MIKTKTYTGRILGHTEGLPGAEVLVDGMPLKHYIRHSPTGFQWGYEGSGPADLARSILINHFAGNEQKAEKYYQRFKVCFVSVWDQEWEITSDDVNRWLAEETVVVT